MGQKEGYTRGKIMTAKESEEQAIEAFKRLYQVTQALLGENGCPWDKAQTPLTMRSFLMEEMNEAIDAITECKPQHAKEELGDTLFNIMLTSALYTREGDFDISQVMNDIASKLIRRHPHIKFDSSLRNKDCPEMSEEGVGAQENTDIKTVLNRWDRIKENVEGRHAKSVLDSVPKGFPPLQKSYDYCNRAAKQGFDWPSEKEAREKFEEELKEVDETLKENNASHLEEEVGDVLFAMASWARKLGVDPVVALQGACNKFYKHYTSIEEKIKAEGASSSHPLPLSRINDLWR